MMISELTRLRLAMTNVIRDRSRSLVCILTIASGIFSLCLFEGFNSGALWTYQERVVHTRLGHFQIEKAVADDILSTDAEARQMDNVEEVSDLFKGDSRVAGVYPRLKLSALIINDRATVPIMAEGVQADLENDFFNELEYVAGRPLSGAEDEILVGVGVAAALGLTPGTKVTLMGNTVRGSLNALDLEVVGTFSGGVKEFDESFVRIPLKTAQKLMDFDGVGTLTVGLKDSSDLGTVLADYVPRVAQMGSLKITDFRDLDKVYYGNSVNWLKAQFFFIRLIILLIVVFGILNTVNISIFERTAEIGTYRAMGFSKSFVRGQIMREYILMGLFGASLGILLSLGVAQLSLAQGVPMPPSPGATRGLDVALRMETWMLVMNLFLGILCAIVATAWPARRAVRISIVEALGHRI